MNPPEPPIDYGPFWGVLIVCLVIYSYSVASDWMNKKVDFQTSLRATFRWFATMGTTMAILICGSNMHQFRSMPWWEKGAAMYLSFSLGEVLVAHWSGKFAGKPPEVAEGPRSRPPGPTPG